MGILERQLEHDRDMRSVERLHSLISQGSKGISVLSGGAALGVLAFIQALIDKPVYPCFKPFAAIALSFFMVSAFLPAVAFFFHFGFLNRPYAAGREKKLRVVWWLLGGAVLLLLSGGLVVASGVWFAL
jgi:hypothetical protein